MSKKELEKVDNTVLSDLKTREEYEILIESGALPSSIGTPEKAMAIIQMGKELGLPAIVAMNNINMIQGRAVISSTMLGAMLKARNIEWVWTKDHAVEEVQDSEDIRIVTEIEFEWISKVTKKPKSTTFSITWAQMEVAGYTEKQNWSKYPKEMMRARCMAYAVRAIFPEVLMGMYTDLEMLDANDINKDVKLSPEGDVYVDDAEEIIE
jgi:hypothetical protein